MHNNHCHRVTAHFQSIIIIIIIIIIIKWKCMVNFTLWALYPQGKYRSIPTKWVAEWDRTRDPSIRTIVFTLTIVGWCVNEKWLRSIVGMILEWENLSTLQKAFHSATFFTISPLLIRVGSSQDLHVERPRNYDLNFGACWGSVS